jgi:hypothetical protein
MTGASSGGQVAVCKGVGGLLPRKQEIARLVGRKFKAGRTMSKLKFSPEFLAQVHELAVSWGKRAAQRATAEAGAQAPMTFTEIEQFAARIAAGVTEGTVTTLLEEQAQALDSAPCPACGTPCPVERQDRPPSL